MGWLSGWFRHRTDDTNTKTAGMLPLEVGPLEPAPLSGEAPPRTPSRRGAVGAATGMPASAAPAADRGAAAAAVGGAVLIGAEVIHMLTGHAAAATTGPTEQSAIEPGGDRHDAPTAAPDASHPDDGGHADAGHGGDGGHVDGGFDAGQGEAGHSDGGQGDGGHAGDGSDGGDSGGDGGDSGN